MNRLDVAILTLRVFALYAWFQALELFASGALGVFFAVVYQIGQKISFAAALSVVLPPLVFFAVGIFVFVRSRELAAWLLPLPSETDEASLPPHPLAAASLAFAVVGVAIFLYAIPQALSYAISFIQIGDAKKRELQFSLDAPRIIGLAVQLVLGFLLFINSRTFASVWWRKQRFGPRK